VLFCSLIKLARSGVTDAPSSPDLPFFPTILCSLLLTPVTLAHSPTVTTDPVTRYFQITYPVPADAPDVVDVHCSVSPAGAGAWVPARVTPLVSETALVNVPDAEWTEWTSEGRVTERRAAGLERTLVVNSFPGQDMPPLRGLGGRLGVDLG
jgi:hypothetical protein